jgi:uncharacterized membrane protein YhaH (DUF805 family)
MTFGQSIEVCLSKYANFSGRASRSEYWWWALFVGLTFRALDIFSDIAPVLFALAVLMPSFAVGTRRHHDIDKSGWFQLLHLAPLIGWTTSHFGLPSRAASQTDSDLAWSRKDRNATLFPAY